MVFGALGDIHGDFAAARRIMERHDDVPFWVSVGDLAGGHRPPLVAQERPVDRQPGRVRMQGVQQDVVALRNHGAGHEQRQAPPVKTEAPVALATA